MTCSRRSLLQGIAGGFGGLAAGALLHEADSRQATAGPTSPARDPTSGATLGPSLHHAPRARRVIFLFMSGGPSHLDTFDPKPALVKFDGQRLPVLPHNDNRLLGKIRPLGNAFPSPWKFSRHGAAGIDVSELFPEVARRADDLCVIRSLCCDSFFHAQGTLEMMTGNGLFQRPSLGAWLLYGLGVENRSIPGFVVLGDMRGGVDAVKSFGSAFLPGSLQGTRIGNLREPLADLAAKVPAAEQRAQLDLLQAFNRSHQQSREDESALEARIASFEMAFRMQTEAVEAFDLGKETASVRKLYGADESPTADFAQRCITARRLVERGVRFVIVNHNDWDQHSNLKDGHAKNARQVDRPIAGLLADLKQRGLLHDTLVLWGGEFGRTPNTEGKNGRDHNINAFTMWMAGGGVKAGHVHGVTDEFGAYIVEKRVHVHDLHATILHLLGLDHARLTYRYGGRDHRLTDVHGNVVRDILA